MNNQQAFRADVLRRCGATEAEVEELLQYNQNVFDHGQICLGFPLEDEPFVEAWAQYAEASEHDGVFETLKEQLIQLQFPIQEGISQNDAYQTAIRQGRLHRHAGQHQGLSLDNPEALRLMLYPTPAGRIPVLIITERSDFVRLVQALTRRNEPQPIPPSMGACMVAGYNNWARIRALRLQWSSNHPGATEAEWKQVFRRIIPQKALYQDRFILLSDGPYSAVPAASLGLTDAEWRSFSLTIRLEHECAHYFTRRVLGSMRSALFDELLADYMGLVVAVGRFRADWFLRFMGLERFPHYREGGRLQNYRGKPPLSQGAFELLQTLVHRAAENLERFDTRRTLDLSTPQKKAWLLWAFSQLTLEELAAENGATFIDQRLTEGVRMYQDVVV